MNKQCNNPAKTLYPPYLLVIFVTGIGAFMAALDIGIINIALPFLQSYFHAPLTTVAWTITIYTLMLTCLMILFGKLSDCYGRRPIFQWGVIIFTVSSLLCGLATSPMFLILARAAQGIGAAMIQATAVALITSNLPEDNHANGIGTYSTLLGLGNIVGVSIGGLILFALGWKWIFYINIPFGISVLWGSFYLLKDNLLAKEKIDYIGIIALGVSIIGLLMAIESMANPDKTLARNYYFILFISSFGFFCIYEYLTKDKLIDFKYFLNKQMLALSFGTIVFGLSLAVYLAVPPLYLKAATHLQSWVIGLITLSGPIGYVVFSKNTAKLMKHFKNKQVLVFGELIMLVSMLALYEFQWGISLYLFCLLLFVIGAGGGLLFTANVVCFMQETPKKIHGIAGSYSRMLHSFGLAMGAAVTAMLIQKAGMHGNPQAGFSHVWIFGAAVTLISILIFVTVKFKPTRVAEDIKQDTLNFD